VCRGRHRMVFVSMDANVESLERRVLLVPKEEMEPGLPRVMGLPKQASSARAGSAPEHVHQGLTRTTNHDGADKVSFGVSAENHALKATHERRGPMFGVMCCVLWVDDGCC